MPAAPATIQSVLCFPAIGGANSASRLGGTGHRNPAATFPRRRSLGTVNNYTNNSEKNTWQRRQVRRAVDFINQKTGNWSWYYHIDNSTVDNALPDSPACRASPPSLPTRAQQFVMSNTKTFGATAVNEARFSFFRTALHQGQSGREFRQPVVARFRDRSRHARHHSLDRRDTRNTCRRFTSTDFNIGVPTLNTFQPNNTFMVS